jgi:GNAT superfamily N-acetyltransferase
MKIIITPARVEDLEKIVEFNAALAYETEGKVLDRDQLTRGVRAVLESPEKGQYYVAKENQVVVGQLMLTREWSDWRNGYFWWIQSVYVHRDWRKSGIFRALYLQVEMLTQMTPGVCGLRLYVDQENMAAQQTYVRMGMHVTNYRLFEVEFKK